MDVIWCCKRMVIWSFTIFWAYRSGLQTHVKRVMLNDVMLNPISFGYSIQKNISNLLLKIQIKIPFQKPKKTNVELKIFDLSTFSELHILSKIFKFVSFFQTASIKLMITCKIRGNPQCPGQIEVVVWVGHFLTHVKNLFVQNSQYNRIRLM